jgi:4-amino-4-deoxy-L-arabinose transferase-like glycosyltransferase
MSGGIFARRLGSIVREQAAKTPSAAIAARARDGPTGTLDRTISGSLPARSAGHPTDAVIAVDQDSFDLVRAEAARLSNLGPNEAMGFGRTWLRPIRGGILRLVLASDIQRGGGARIEAPAWDRKATIALCVLLIGSIASLRWLVHPWYEASIDTNDGAMYLLCTRSLVEGHGYAYLGIPFNLRPPGFSVLIAPIVAWRGFDFWSLNLLVSVFGALAATLQFLWCRSRLGTWPAFLCAALLWLNPGWQHSCNQVMSDVPGVALLFLCLLLERRADRARSLGPDLALGLCIGLSAYVRSALVLLVPAIVAARTCSHLGEAPRPRRWLAFARIRLLLPALIPMLVLLPWDLRNARFHPDPPVDQNGFFSYSTAMWHVDPAEPSSPFLTPAEVLARIPHRIPQVLSTLGSRMQSSAGDRTDMMLGLLACVAVLVVLLRRRATAEFLFAIVLGVELVYFDFQPRLVLTLFALSIPCVVEVAMTLLARVVGRGTALAATLAALCIWIAADFRPRMGWKSLEAEHAHAEALARDLGVHLPSEARVAAPLGWHHSIYLGRPVWSLYFAVRRTKSIEAIEQIIDKYRIDHVVMSVDPPDDPVMLAWFRARYREESAGSGAVFRVRND